MAFRLPRLTPATLILLVTALAFAVMFLFTPVSVDDLWYYQRSIEDFLNNHSPGMPLDRIKEEIVWRYKSDNARLSNVLFAFAVYLPRWIPALITSVFNLWCMYGLARLARIESPDWKAMVWFCFMYTICIPWIEFLFTSCFHFNYVWALALALWIIFQFFKDKPASVWLLLPAAVIFGAWHEGFSIPIFFGFLAIFILWSRRFITLGNVLILTGMLAGILWLCVAPPFYNRGEELSCLLDIRRWLSCLRYDFLYTAYAVLFIICACRRRTRHLVFSPFFVFILMLGLVALPIHVMTNFAYRIGICAEFFAIPGLISLIAKLYKRRGRMLVFASVVAGIFLLLHLIVSCVMTVRFHEQYDEMYSKYRQSPDGKVFVRFIHDFQAPLLALGKPLFWNSDIMMTYHGSYFGHKLLLPAPVELADVDSTSGSPVLGREGLREMDGFFFIDADNVDIPRDRWKYIDGNVGFGGLKIHRVIYAIPFVSRRDGRDYFYVYISGRMPMERFAPITSVEW